MQKKGKLHLEKCPIFRYNILKQFARNVANKSGTEGV